jgi:glucose/arabinose dehydrogenase
VCATGQTAAQVGVPAIVRALVVIATVLALAGCSGSEPVATERSEPTVPTTAETTPSTTGEDRVATGPLRVKLTRVAANLDAPTHVAFAPGERGRLYVVEQAGRIQAVEDGKVGRQPFLDISGLVVSGGEQGLLSAAFHPDYERNRLFYVDYTDVNGDTRVVEYEARDDDAPARVRELLFVDQPYANHNGGQLAFGPDGRLYVGMGDGGSGGDPENRAQNLSERLGKLLSLDVDRPGGRWRIEGYGLRNPWRFSFDRKSGDLWIGDVGQGEWEEIDHSPRESLGLENYGWDVLEGTHSHEDKDPNARGRLVAPVAEYSHEEGCSVTGGFVYRGERIPAAHGRYFYGDYCSGFLWTVSPQDGTVSRPRRLPFDLPTLSSFGEDAAGELYLAALDGNIYRLDAR